MKKSIVLFKLLLKGKIVTIILSFLILVVPLFSQPASIDLRIPSESAGSEGIVVRVIPPQEARYGSKAPIAISVPGGFTNTGLDLRSAPMASEGFIEIRFNFPGGGRGELQSGGTYDNRGANCMKGLRDVIRFTLGKIGTTNGKTLSDIVKPIVPESNNVGLIGYSHGGNATIAVAGIHGESISSLAWILNWESPVGDGMVTADAGDRRGKLNPAYNPETGEFDLSLLTFNPELPPKVVRPRGQRGESLKGGLFFDINKDGKFNEDVDFALNPFIWNKKAFYAVRIIRYATQNNLIPSSHSDRIATPKEADRYWRMRTGHYWFKEVVKKIPGIIFIVLASEVDHVQEAPDHPHVLIQYEGMRRAGARFVRINPDRAYVEDVWDRSVPQAVDNMANKSFNHKSIRTAVQPEEVPRNINVLSAACELADRTHTGNMNPQLDKILITKE